jgi:hypothetical protein
MVHAGVLPSWTVARPSALAGEVEAVLRSPRLADFLAADVRQQADHWDDTSPACQRGCAVIVNVLTRLRFCTPTVMDFDTKEGAGCGACQGTCPGSMCPAGAPRTSRWHSATGRRWAGWADTMCCHWTPAASGAAPSARCAWPGVPATRR